MIGSRRSFTWEEDLHIFEEIVAIGSNHLFQILCSGVARTCRLRQMLLSARDREVQIFSPYKLNKTSKNGNDRTAITN